ncbi:MAG: hypothetical protein C5B58_10650, partial [Acidobacteria bacterium]
YENAMSERAWPAKITRFVKQRGYWGLYSRNQSFQICDRCRLGVMSYSIEKQIEEWLAQQGPEELPGKGKPIDLDEYFRSPEDLRIGYSILKSAGCYPEEVEQIRQISGLENDLSKCVDPDTRVRLRSQLNEAQVRLNLKLEAARSRRWGKSLL